MSIAQQVLYANEVGSGRGHVSGLASFAKRLGLDLPGIAALSYDFYADELTDLGFGLLKSPPLGYTAEDMVNIHLMGNRSWADYLFSMGLARPQTVRHSLKWWINTIYSNNIAILVAEYAPMALLAAQYVKMANWDIQVVSIGNGYGNPPSGLKTFPQFMPDHNRIALRESDGLAMINQVLAEISMPALANLSDIYKTDMSVPITYPFLDPYLDQRPKGQLILPNLGFSDEPSPLGDEVYIYFSESELDNPDVLKVLLDLPLKRRAFLPKTRPEICAQLRASGVEIEPNLMPMQQLISRTKMFLHAGSHGMVCLGSALGIAQIALPQHLEHEFHADRARQMGICKMFPKGQFTAAQVIEQIAASYTDAALLATCRALAQDLRRQVAQPAQRDLAAELAALRLRAGFAPA